MEFSIKKDGTRGYVLIRNNFPREFHAHIKTKNGCRQLLHYIDKKLLPKSEYLQGSARRLLTDAEYQRLKESKQRYYNHSKKDYQSSYR